MHENDIISKMSRPIFEGTLTARTPEALFAFTGFFRCDIPYPKQLNKSNRSFIRSIKFAVSSASGGSSPT